MPHTDTLNLKSTCFNPQNLYLKPYSHRCQSRSRIIPAFRVSEAATSFSPNPTPSHEIRHDNNERPFRSASMSNQPITLQGVTLMVLSSCQNAHAATVEPNVPRTRIHRGTKGGCDLEDSIHSLSYSLKVIGSFPGHIMLDDSWQGTSREC